MLKKQPLYDALIVRIFKNHFRKGAEAFEFDRTEIETVAAQLNLALPKNLGDLIYSFRYRKALPPEIVDTETGKKQWTILPAGRSKYRFALAMLTQIVPRPDLVATKVPDATPQIIAAYALTDEQALLAKVRYNRLIDIFLGIATYSLQNHLRTTVKGMGQIEIDEIYVGIGKTGPAVRHPRASQERHGQVSGRSDQPRLGLLRGEVCRSCRARHLRAVHARRHHRAIRAHLRKRRGKGGGGGAALLSCASEIDHQRRPTKLRQSLSLLLEAVWTMYRSKCGQRSWPRSGREETLRRNCRLGNCCGRLDCEDTASIGKPLWGSQISRGQAVRLPYSSMAASGTVVPSANTCRGPTPISGAIRWRRIGRETSG